MIATLATLAPSAVADAKALTFIRHGVTEMNMYLSSNPYPSGSPGDNAAPYRFVDPPLFDTRLTEVGRTQATMLQSTLAAIHAEQPIELVVASPLSRALETADLALGPIDVPCAVNAQVAERRYLSSDIGRSPDALATAYPRFAASVRELPSEWWWEGDEQQKAAAQEERLRLQRGSLLGQMLPGGPLEGVAVAVEPADHFVERIASFRDWLRARPERHVVVVAHWGALYSMLGGRSLKNCEVVRTSEAELPELVPAPD